MRDLLGIKDDVGADLPLDEGAGGFYSNLIAPVTELHLDKYQGAAEALARRAVADLPALVGCDPKVGAVCAAQFIERFGRRAYRRPLSAPELDRFKRLHAEATARADFAAGVRVVMQAMLQSLHFLYRFELAPLPPGGKGGIVLLPPHAVASRLSYFLWNTMPDEALFAAADANQLGTTDQVSRQAARMIADPRFRDTIVSFHAQWLNLVELPEKEKTVKVYPAWSPALRAAMREETLRFVDYVLREGDGRLDTLLTARFSMIGGPLVELYGLGKAPATTVWQRTDLDPRQRAGILTQASVLAVHAHPDQPSLVHRGKLIREKVLCQMLPPPPADVNNTLPPADPTRSSRAQFEQHRADPGCAGCHRLIDPLGAPFETYDGIGRFRTMDGPRAVDSLGEVIGLGRSDGPVKNAVELVERLAAADEVRACFTKQWLRFALGREEDSDEAGSLAVALGAFRDAGHRIPDLVAAITRTDAFRYQQVRP